VFLNNQKQSELILAGAGYIGHLPAYDGTKRSIGTKGIAEWMREASQINRTAKTLLSDIDKRTQSYLAASRAISDIAEEARNLQSEFLDDMRISRCDLGSLSEEEKEHLQEAYTEWLGTTEKLELAL